MDEKIDVLDEKTGVSIGEIISKSDAHKKGVWHGSVHLIIINKDKTKTLFQKRASVKDLYPNMWDIAVGGHISSGETDLIAVKRELFEELGINPNNYKIEFIKKYKEELFNKGIISKEFVSLYILYLDNELENFELQEDEVDSVCWVTKDEMELLIKEEKLIPHKEEYKFIREILK